MFACCCASEDCQVNGCARYRALKRPEARELVYPPLGNTGWTCPACGKGNAPGVQGCVHCAGALTDAIVSGETVTS